MAWTDVEGLDLAKRIWQAHLATGQVASAYMLSGPDGIGKRKLAFELAKTLICPTGGTEGCGQCQSCGQVMRGVHPDAHVIQPAEEGAEQIKIQDMRTLIGRVGLRPFSSRFQVAIIADAERLTEEAANSILKSLEEPTAHTRFVLTTRNIGQCLPTIVSRCQVIRCAPLPEAVVAKLVGRELGCDAETASLAAREGEGSVSAALAAAERLKERTSLQALFARTAREWIGSPLPERRQEVIELLDAMVERLAELAAGQAAGAAVMTEASSFAPDPDAFIDAAFDLIELRDSVEHNVNPKIAANIAREKWLQLIA